MGTEISPRDPDVVIALDITAVTPFDFDGLAVRIVDRDGNPWFVLADVCDVLEIGNPSQAASRLDEDEKEAIDFVTLISNEGKEVKDLAGGSVTIINESGLYSLILTSRKPNAKRFKKWVTAEVLPTIRKTGRYTIPAHAAKPTVLAGAFPRLQAEFSPAFEIARLIGLDRNQAALAAARGVKSVTGQDPLALMGATHLLAPQQADHLSPTEIGVRLGGRPAIEVNGLLHEQGFQTSWRDEKNRLHWEPTEQGKRYAVWLDTGKKHSDGAPVRQLRWSADILTALATGTQAH